MCKQCTDATYQPEPGQGACLNCTAGSYSSGGEAGNTGCTECPAGSACDGTAVPTECGETEYAALESGEPVMETGATRCLPCKAGHRCEGGLLKEQCDKGWAAELGAGECTHCIGTTDALYATDANGDTPEKGAIACAPCRAGYGCKNGELTELCTPGTYAAKGAGTCEQCTGAQYTAGADSQYTASGASQCLECPAGRSCENGKLGELCGPGTYATKGAAACRKCGDAEYAADATGAGV